MAEVENDPNRAVESACVRLHLAEYLIHQSKFSEAVQTLRRASRSLSLAASSSSSPIGVTHCSPYWASLVEGEVQRESAGDWQALLTRRWQMQIDHLHSNTYALLGVCTFRDNPSHPEYALSLLEEGLHLFPRSMVLLLCSGEVHSQCGDMVKAIKQFHKCTELDPTHPLPWVNAGRTYQQLGQVQAALMHVRKSIEIDPTLAMTRVDLAQLLRQNGHMAEAVQEIDKAMELAKQVSEIRDVLTARYVVLLQQSLKKKGLYSAAISL